MSIHKRSVRVHSRLQALSYARRLWQAIDTPISLSCYLLSKHGEWAQLARKKVDPLHYCEPTSFYLDYQAVKLLSKYPKLDTGINTEVEAKKKFVEAESKCLETNIAFSNGCAHLSERAKRVLCRAQRKIAVILGDVPSLDRLDFAFGPGASYGIRGDTSVYKKMTSHLECTYAFTDILPQFLEEFPGWIPEGTQEVRLVPGSQLTIVPKDATTGRPICIEPLLNGMYQKGVGSWIRDRLKRFGIDLRDQGVNQKLASLAYTEGLSTVDFRSASDTIAYMLVLDLLPIDWFEFLNVARCPRYECEGNWYNFQKFTSMGNAYTFELETLIFYAIACSCCEEEGIEYLTSVNLSVYGDDVIIPRAAFDLFSEVTEGCGFTINKEKSFYQGNFFESCGHDYFMGIFVRPFILDKELKTLLHAFYVANSTLRFARNFKKASQERIVGPLRMGLDEAHIDRIRGCYDWVVGCIGPQFRVVGPEGFGDGHLIASCPKDAERHPSWDGWWFRTYIERPVRIKYSDWPMAYALYFNRGSTKDVYLDGSDPFFCKRGESIEVHNSDGYQLRGRKTSLSSKKVFCNFVWQETFSWAGVDNKNDSAPV